jgi:hypothetical protein
MFQKLIGSAMVNQHALTCEQMIRLFEKEFGIDFSSAIVPLSDEGYVLWVFNSNDDNDVTLHQYALGIRTKLTAACKEVVLKALRNPDEAKDYGKLVELLPRIWLLPTEEITSYMRHSTFQATQCSFENADAFRKEARVSILDYCFVPASLCEYHEVNLL